MTVLLTPKDVSAIRHDEANKYSAVFLAELPNGLQIAGLNSGTLVDRADVRQSTGTLRIRRLYVSPAQHPQTGRNVCDCELQKGKHIFTVRCFEGGGTPQIAREAPPDPSGATGFDTRSVML